MKVLSIIVILMMLFTPIFASEEEVIVFEIKTYDFSPSQMAWTKGTSSEMIWKGIGTILLLTACFVGVCWWGAQWS